MKLALVLAACVFCALAHMTAADECGYADCIFEEVSPRETGLDEHVFDLNFDHIPDEVGVPCELLENRTRICEEKFSKCPETLTESWERRMYDSYYVHYVVTLALAYCKNREPFLELKRCITKELYVAIKECIHDEKFDIECVEAEYDKQEKCSDEADRIFKELLEMLNKINEIRKVREDTESKK